MRSKHRYIIISIKRSLNHQILSEVRPAIANSPTESSLVALNRRVVSLTSILLGGYRALFVLFLWYLCGLNLPHPGRSELKWSEICQPFVKVQNGPADSRGQRTNYLQTIYIYLSISMTLVADIGECKGIYYPNWFKFQWQHATNHIYRYTIEYG